MQLREPIPPIRNPEDLDDRLRQHCLSVGDGSDVGQLDLGGVKVLWACGLLEGASTYSINLTFNLQQSMVQVNQLVRRKMVVSHDGTGWKEASEVFSQMEGYVSLMIYVPSRGDYVFSLQS